MSFEPLADRRSLSPIAVMRCSWFLISAAIWLFSSGQRAWSQVSGAPPAVQSVALSDGEIQRSLVKSIRVHYAQGVNAPVLASDLVLYNITHSLAIPTETQAVTYDAASRTARFTFPTIHGGALPQGNYIARVLAPFDPATVLTCGSASPLPPDFVFSFHVRFGDMDGDRDVDFQDASRLWKAWNRSASAPGYNSALDFTFDGKVDQADGTIFTWNYFTVFPAAPALHAQLLNDTGISPRDGTTSDSSVTGNIIDPAAVAKLQGRFISGQTGFTDLTGAVNETGDFLIPAAMMPAIYGGTLPFAQNILQLQTLDTGGSVVSTAEVSFQFHAFNNCPPFFTSTPTPAAAVKISDQPALADLSRWTVVPYLLNGFGQPNWVLEENNTVARQGVNVTASILLSDFESENSRIRGSWRVDTADDDDYMGFVFGFQNDQQFYLFDWKELDQDGHDGGIEGLAERGMSIKKVRAVTSLTDLWQTDGTPNVDIIYHNTIPWEHSADYEFTLDYFPPNIDITISKAGAEVATIHVEDSTYSSGRFGFYNFSQEQLLYRGFTRAAFPEQTYAYQAKAVDPDNDALTYTIISGPAGLKMDALTGFLSWAPSQSQFGEHPVKIMASDGKGGAAEQEFIISIVNYDAPPTVSLIATKQVVIPNETTTINVMASDDVAVSVVRLTVNGTATPLDTAGNAVVSLPDIGFLNATATAKDNAGHTTASSMQIRVRDPKELIFPDPAGPAIPGGSPSDPVKPGGPTGDPADVPVIELASPTPEATISQLTTITGSITSLSNTLHSWRVEFAPADQVNLYDLGAAGPDWKLIGSGNQPVTNGALAVFDPTLLPDNSYVVRAVAFNTNGRGWAEALPINVAGSVKLGNFRLEFTDLQIPLVGIPITVGRVYDTLEAGTKGDFGYGWKLGLQDGDIHETTPGTGGIFTSNPYKQGSRVYITTPEGKRVGFTFEVEPVAAGLFGVVYKPTFKPDPGVYEKLEASEGDQGFLSLSSSGHVGLYLFGFGWNPDDFILTTRDGVRYSYNQETGLQRAEDLNGNTVTYSRDGAVHSSGVSVLFIRDTEGRITEIRDPDGKPIKYTYDALGNLKTVTDRMDLVTSFDYRTTPAHYLDKITDPLGRQAMRTEYGPDGRIKAVIDALGNRTEQDFDPSNFRGTKVDAEGNVTNLVYDSKGQLLQSTDPIGGIIFYTYDAGGNTTSIKDQNGNITSFAYDERGNVVQIVDALGQKEFFTYNLGNKITSITDQLGRIIKYEYDGKGNIIKFTDAAGSSRTNTYDILGRQIGSIDYNGNQTILRYTQGNLPSEIIHADGTVQKFEFTSSGQLIKVTDERGHQTTARYDDEGRVQSISKANGAVTAFNYSGKEWTGITNPLGRTARFEYDAKGQKIREIDAAGGVRQFVYDGNGRITKNINELGKATDYVYQKDDKLSSITDPAGGVTKFTYDLAGNRLSETDAKGNITSYTYDALNRRITETDPLGNIKRFEYDGVGNRVGVTDELLNVTKYTYDSLNRLISVTTPLSFKQVFSYDLNGNNVRETNALGNSKVNSFDSRNRLVAVTDAEGGITRYEYDGVGNQISITDPLGNKTAFEYDNVNQLARETNPLLKTRTFAYDLAGNVVEKVDRNLRKRTFNYDVLDRLTEEIWWNGTSSVRNIVHTFDSAGNRLTSKDIDSSYIYEYDSKNQVITENNKGTPGALEIRLSLGYDPLGNQISVSDNLGANVTSVYDKRNLLSRRVWQNGAASQASVEFSYDERGDRLGIRRFSDIAGALQIGSTVSEYDNDGRITDLTHLDSASTPISDYDYFYDAESRVSQVTDHGRITGYTYDRTDQLTATTNSGQPDETFKFDANGNPSGAGIVMDGANRLRADSNFDYAYDDEGNLSTKLERATGIKTAYTFDHRKRLVSVIQRNAASLVLHDVRYVYDVEDRRIGKTVDGVTARFAYNGDASWADINSTGTIMARYLSTDEIDSFVARDRTVDGIAWYLPDSLGTVRDLANAAGSVANRRNFRAFGMPVSETSPSTGDRFAFTGREFDSETGLYFYRARFYDPLIGRFISEDPTGFDAGDTNLFRYVGNKVTNYKDPLGLAETINYGSFAGIMARALVQTLTAEIRLVTTIKGDGFLLTITTAGSAGLAGAISHFFVSSGATLESTSGRTNYEETIHLADNLTSKIKNKQTEAPVSGAAAGSPGGDPDDENDEEKTPGTRRKNRIPDEGEPNTVKWNDSRTTAKKYGPDGKTQKEFNKGHQGSGTPDVEKVDHVHDYKPSTHPNGRPVRQPGRPVKNKDYFDFKL